MVRQHLDWLGAAQLEAGGSCPVRCSDLFHHQKQPLAFLTICLLDGTDNWWLLLPMFLSSSNSWMKLECPLQMTVLSKVYGSSGLPNSQNFPLGSIWCGPMKRISPVLIGIRKAAGVAGSVSIDYICLMGSTPDILWRFISLSLFFSWTHRQWGFFLSGLHS